MRTVLPAVPQDFLKVVADGLALAVRIGCEVDVVNGPGGLPEFLDELLLAFDHLVARLETVVDIHRQVPLGKIHNMTERSHNHELLAQVFIDRLCLSGRFHDYKSFCHRKLSEISRTLHRDGGTTTRLPS